MTFRVQPTAPKTPQTPKPTPSTGEVHEAAVQEPAESVGSPASQQPSSSATSDQTGGIPVGQDESVPVEAYEPQQEQSEKQTQEQDKKDKDSSTGIKPQSASTSKSTPEEEATGVKKDADVDTATPEETALEAYRRGSYQGDELDYSDKSAIDFEAKANSGANALSPTDEMNALMYDQLGHPEFYPSNISKEQREEWEDRLTRSHEPTYRNRQHKTSGRGTNSNSKSVKEFEDEETREERENLVNRWSNAQKTINRYRGKNKRTTGAGNKVQDALLEQVAVLEEGYQLMTGLSVEEFYKEDEDHKKWWHTVNNIASFLTRADYNVMSYDKAVDNIRCAEAIRETRMFFGVNVDDKTYDSYIYEMAALQLGFAPDTHQELFNRPEYDSGVTADGFVGALQQIRENINNPSLICPFRLNPGFYMGGTQCIPVPIMPESLLKWMTEPRKDNHFATVDLDRIRKACIQEWTGVHEEGRDIDGILDWMKQNCSPEQQIAVEAIVEAVEFINGTDNEYSGHHFNKNLAGLYALEMQQAQNATNSEEAVKEVSHMNAYRCRTAKRVFTDADNRRELSDSKGRLYQSKDIVNNPVLLFFSKLADAIKGWGLLSNLEVGIPATLERIAGTVDLNFDTWILNMTGNIGNSKGNFQKLPTKMLNDIAHNEELSKTVSNVFRGWTLGSHNDILERAKNNKLNGEKENLQGRNKADTLVNQLMHYGGIVSEGLPLFNGSDVKRFVEYYWWALSRAGKINMSAEELYAALTTDPDNFVNTALQTDEGIAAATWMTQTVIGGANPLCEFVYQFLAKHRVTSVVLTMFVDKYFTYGFAVSQKLIPFSHTASYLITKGLTAKSDKKGLQDMLIGNNLGFLGGLLTNLLLDCEWLASRSLGVFLLVGIAMLLGVEPPDEDDKKNVYGEWKIGGLAIKESWLWRDLLAPVFIPAMTIIAAMNDGDPFGIFVSGCEQAFQDMPWFNLGSVIDVVVNFDQLLYEDQDEINAKWDSDEAPEAYSAEWWSILMETTALTDVCKWFEPSLLNQIYRSAGPYQYSDTMVWTTDINGEPTDTERTTYADAQRRSVARRHMLAGLILDIANGTFWSNQTGYLKFERPLAEFSDPAQQASYENNVLVSQATFEKDIKENGKNSEYAEYIDKKTGKPDWDAYAVATCERIMNDMKEADFNPEWLRQNAYVIPSDTKDYLISYIDSAQSLLRHEYKGDGGLIPSLYSQYGAIGDWDTYYKESDRLNKEYDNKRQEYQNMLNCLYHVDSDYTKYYIENTNYRSYYKNEDTGEVSNPWNYLWRGLTGENISKNPYAAGETPSPLPLYLSVNQTGNYDEQTAVPWTGEYTDLDAIKKLTGDMTYPAGSWLEGENVYDTLTGHGTTGKDEEGNPILLTGQRAAIPKETVYKATGENKEAEAWDPYDAKQYKDENTSYSDSSSSSSGGGSSYSHYNGSSNFFRSYGRSSYNYRHSYSGGSSHRGSSYTQKVYSRGSYSGIKTNYANTSYSKNLQYSKYGYLYPKVSTKGSRWGYRRQDM